MPVSERERALYVRDVRRIRRTLSPKVKSHAICTILGRWQTIHDRHGKAHRIEVFHVYEQDASKHPSTWDYKDENWLGSFPFREEAEQYVKGFQVGKSQVAIRSGLGMMKFRFGVRAPTGAEAPTVVMTDRGPQAE